MLIILNKSTGKRITDFGTNNAFPDGIELADADWVRIEQTYNVLKTDCIEYRINDSDSQVAQILASDVSQLTATISSGVVTAIQTVAYVPPAPTLDEAKTAKIVELYAKRDQTIEAGFTATNGHQYFFGDTDQKKMQGKIALLGVSPTVTSVGWLTNDAGFITHTRDEFIQVATDADQFETDQHMKCYQLENQVWATTTIDQINAIVW